MTDDTTDTDRIAAAYDRYEAALVESTERAHERERHWGPDGPQFDVDTSEFDEYLADLTGLDAEARAEFHDRLEDVHSRQTDAYREYYEAEVRPSLVVEVSADDETRWPGPTPASLDAETRQAVPVSTLVVASDADLLPQADGDTEVHNPYTKTFGAKTRQPLCIDYWGSGDGLYGLTPEHLSSRTVTVHWNFLYKPSVGASNLGWKCWTDLFLLGKYACHVNDGKFSSLYAGIKLTTSLRAVPLGPNSAGETTGTGTVTDEMQILEVAGYNVNRHGRIDIEPALSVEPRPWARGEMHAITVSVTASVKYRGESHVMVDLENDYYRRDGTIVPAGAYCWAAEIDEPTDLWSYG